jgi:hypothetical protein
MFGAFDPTTWGISHEAYNSQWYRVAGALLTGTWAKIFGTIFLFASVYSAMRRKFRPVVTFLCFFFAVLFAYGGMFFGWMF